MIAFHGNKSEKAAILKQLRAHAKADQLVQGYGYWADGKGCAVGCTVHSDDHAAYEKQFGIPQMLARLEDCIFEGLSKEEARKWPVAFMTAIKPGADLSLIGWKFLHWLLTDEKVNPGITHPLVKDAVKQCADLMASLAEGKGSARSARSAESAESAAESAASAASAESAARSARSAWSAARSAAAAESAASAARSARSAESAESAWSAAWSEMSSKLLELLHDA